MDTLTLVIIFAVVTTFLLWLTGFLARKNDERLKRIREAEHKELNRLRRERDGKNNGEAEV